VRLTSDYNSRRAHAILFAKTESNDEGQGVREDLSSVRRRPRVSRSKYAMKTSLVRLVLAAALASLTALPAQADRGDFRGRHFDRGGFQSKHFNRGDFRGRHFDRGAFQSRHFNRGGFQSRHFDRRDFPKRFVGHRSYHGHYRYHNHHAWRRGYWHHGHHDGHWGWWWIVAGTWYFYPRPVYPYPPVVVQTTPAPAVVEPAPQPSVPVWYYCDSAAAYYPYVQECPGGWRSVPAVPPEGRAD
jgi:hypothetical protein